MAEKQIHFGHYFAWLMKSGGRNFRRLSEASGISQPTLFSYLKMKTPRMYDSNYGKLAIGLEMSVEELDRWKTTPVEAKVARPKKVAPVPTVVPDAWDASKPGRILPPIPTYDLYLTASDWVELRGVELNTETHDDRVKEAGRFRVRIHGACMEPAWCDGEIVEFEVWNRDSDVSLMGKDCYIQRSDGRATFKTFVYVDHAADDEWVLKAINPDFPNEIRVPDQEVSRVAIAVGTFVPPRPRVSLAGVVSLTGDEFHARDRSGKPVGTKANPKRPSPPPPKRPRQQHSRSK